VATDSNRTNAFGHGVSAYHRVPSLLHHARMQFKWVSLQRAIQGTSRQGSRCMRKLRSRNASQPYNSLFSSGAFDCKRACRMHPQRRARFGSIAKDKVAYVFSLYGSAGIFDFKGFCPLCVALMTLHCIGTVGLPIILMHTHDVPLWELQLLAAIFPHVSLHRVDDIHPSKQCLASLPQAQSRLKRVLMKLNYWNMSRFEQVMPMDSDTLALNNLDKLLTHRMPSPLAAVPLHVHRQLTTKTPWYGQPRHYFFTFNSGVMVVQPSEAHFATLKSAIPHVHHCGKVVEQTLLFKLKNGMLRRLVELPTSYNCVSRQPKGCKEFSRMPVHVMHFAGPDYKPWKYSSKTAFAWLDDGPGSEYLALWHYYHRRFMWLACGILP